MHSVPRLALFAIPLNFLPRFGPSYMPKIVRVILIFWSGNGAISSHVLYEYFAVVPHSGQIFFLFGFSACEGASVSRRLNLPFA